MSETWRPIRKTLIIVIEMMLVPVSRSWRRRLSRCAPLPGAVRRLNKVYSRRSFAEVLSLGDIDTQDDDLDLGEAILTTSELQGQAVLPGMSGD
jgi:hypothetical protein